MSELHLNEGAIILLNGDCKISPTISNYTMLIALLLANSAVYFCHTG